jgi:hypothetical protein
LGRRRWLFCAELTPLNMAHFGTLLTRFYHFLAIFYLSKFLVEFD